MAARLACRHSQYGLPGRPAHPPLHGRVHRTAMALVDPTGATTVGGAGGGMRVQLVWTPYERVAYVLWHVALRCVIAGDGSGTAAATGRAAAPHADPAEAEVGGGAAVAAAAHHFGMRNSRRGQGSALPTQAEVWCELPAATDTSPPHRAHLDPSSVVLVPGRAPPPPPILTLGTRDFVLMAVLVCGAGRIYPPRGDGRRSC